MFYLPFLALWSSNPHNTVDKVGIYNQKCMEVSSSLVRWSFSFSCPSQCCFIDGLYPIVAFQMSSLPSKLLPSELSCKVAFPLTSDGPRSTGWREHMERRRRFEFDFRERDDERGYRRVRCGSGSMDDDRDSLPEWCLEDAEEEMGTFDSSGAFLSLKVKSCLLPFMCF